jgi:hypothetical protein
MLSWENPGDRVAIAQMNSELQHAQLELLSAHCASHQLRLRFTIDDLARFGRRDILRKSVEAAASLNEYYSSIEAKISQTTETGEPASLSEAQVREAVNLLSSYLREQSEYYMRIALPLTNLQKAAMWPYFSALVLDRVRIVELKGQRIPNPPFYEQARALGFTNLPEWTHMDSLTLGDVILFNEKLSDRALFHGLVHAIQIELLGIERYSQLFVRGFLASKHHFSVPLEAHAFSLESKFGANPSDRFSVEDRVRLWVHQQRY